MSKEKNFTEILEIEKYKLQGALGMFCNTKKYTCNEAVYSDIASIVNLIKKHTKSLNH